MAEKTTQLADVSSIALRASCVIDGVVHVLTDIVQLSNSAERDNGINERAFMCAAVLEQVSKELEGIT